MNYSIIFSSNTGNTEALATQIRHCIDSNALVSFGAPSAQACESDVIFVGFWTDKGGCDPTVTAFLQTLRNKEIFLFGTAGFGGAPAYFEQILSRVSLHLDSSNTVIGSFMCQGRMPVSVRKRYEAMEQQTPGSGTAMIENYDLALSHPDDDDLSQLKKVVTTLLSERH